MKRRHKERHFKSVMDGGPPHVSHLENFLASEPDIWRHHILPRMTPDMHSSLSRTNRRVRDIIKRHASDKTDVWEKHVEPNRGVWTFRPPITEISTGLDFTTVNARGLLERANPPTVFMKQAQFVQQQPYEKFHKLEIDLEPTGPYDFLNDVRATDLILRRGSCVLQACPPHVDRVCHYQRTLSGPLATCFVKGDDRMYFLLEPDNEFIDETVEEFFREIDDDVLERVGGVHLRGVTGFFDCSAFLRKFPNIWEVFLDDVTVRRPIELPPTVTHLRTNRCSPAARGVGVRFLDEIECPRSNVLPNLEVSVITDDCDEVIVNVHT